MSSYRMMRMLTEVASVVAIFYASLLLILYLVARWRDSRETTPDPELGYKFGLNLFLIVSYNILIIVASVLLYSFIDWMFSGFNRSFMYTAFRATGGLIVPGLVLLFGVRALLKKTNQESYPGVGRLFSGLIWLSVSITAVGAFVFLCQMLFQLPYGGRIDTHMWAMVVTGLLVYVPLSIYFGKQVKQRSVASNA